MFRKIIAVILFAAFAAVVFAVSTSSVSNDRSSTNGGRFAGDHYINESAALDIDLSDRWVYFDTVSAGDALSRLGVTASDTGSGTVLMLASRPGITIAVVDLGEALDKKTLNTENMYKLGNATKETADAKGMRTQFRDHGRLDNTRDIFYYQLSAHIGQTDGDLLYILFNSGSKGIMAVAFADSDANVQLAKNFVLDNIKITYSLD